MEKGKSKSKKSIKQSVRVAKPVKSAKLPLGELKIDMHVHTTGSDGHGTPADYVKAAQAAGLDGIAITDHHHTYTEGGDAVAEAIQKAGMLVIRGCEYSTNQGHILIYGVDADTLKLGYYPEMQAVIDAVNAAGGIAIPAHPYHGYQKGMLGDGIRVLKGIIAVEGVNGRLETESPSKNTRATREAEKKGCSTTGGSDAHYPEDIGLAYTTFPEIARDGASILEALKKGQCAAECNGPKVIKKVAWLMRVYQAKDSQEVGYASFKQ